MSWVLKKIEDFSDVYGGGTPSTKVESYWNGDLPWISPKDLSGYEFKFISKGDRFISKEGLEKSSTRLLPENTILFTSRAPIGYVAIAENAICTNQGFQSLVCKVGISDYEFVFYLLKNNIHIFYNNASGATFPEISNKKVKQIQLLLPPLQTQKRIASILSAYDDLIENNLKRIKLLEETAQNIYKEWFVNFRFPNYENTPFNQETGLPEGWEVKKIEDCEIKIGDGNYSAKYPKSEDFIESGIPFFSTREMNEGRLKTNGVKRISEEQHFTLTKGHLKGGDVILSTRGSIGKVVYVDYEFEDCNINAQLVLFRCDNINFYSKFLYYQLSMPQTFL